MQRRLRILFLASYFPKPDNPEMGNWALQQATALASEHTVLRVVSFTSWVPRLFAATAGARAYANCPRYYDWGSGVVAEYPRWPYYPYAVFGRFSYRYPLFQLKAIEFFSSRWLRSKVSEFEPDIIFCHHSLPNAWLALKAVRDMNVPIISLDHDFDEISSCAYLPCRKAIYDTVSKGVNFMLGVSEKMTDDIKRLFPDAKAYTVHNGTTISRLRGGKEKEERETGVIFFCCAFFSERKGVPLLISAFDIAASENDNIHLRIAGAGPQDNQIRKAIQHSKNQGRITHLGKLEHDEVLKEMHNCSCFILTSWDEPFATVFLEAMGSGRPIICCRDGGITDVIQDGEHGLAISPKSRADIVDAINFISLNETERKRMGEAARRLVVEELSWQSNARNLLDLFEASGVCT